MGTLVWEKSTKYRSGAVDQDGLWKKVIGELFEEFLLFFSPELHAEVDFTIEAEFLQQELFQQIMKGKAGRRSTDQLVKVHLKGGEEKWILVHVEVQTSNEKDFAKRMFQYFYRIYDRFEKEIVTVAILTSPYNSGYPTNFNYTFFGTELHYTYNNYKLIDYDNDSLEKSQQLFSNIILAVKYKNETEENVELRYLFKEKLMRELIKQDRYSDAEVQAVIYFIDYLLRLPKELTGKLYHSLVSTIEEEGKGMVQFNSGEWSPTMEAVFAQLKENAEKVGMEKGLEEGLVQGLEQGSEQSLEKVVVEMLRKGFALELIEEITHLDQEKIESLKDRL